MQHNDMPPGYRITHVLGEPFCTLDQYVNGKWVTLSTHDSLMAAKAAIPPQVMPLPERMPAFAANLDVMAIANNPLVMDMVLEAWEPRLLAQIERHLALLNRIKAEIEMITVISAASLGQASSPQKADEPDTES